MPKLSMWLGEKKEEIPKEYKVRFPSTNCYVDGYNQAIDEASKIEVGLDREKIKRIIKKYYRDEGACADHNRKYMLETIIAHEHEVIVRK